MKISSKNGSPVTINGRSFSGNNISIVGNKVIVNGVEQSGSLVGPITVEVHGDVDMLNVVSGNVTARNVNRVKTGSGDVSCGDVNGDISTGSGDVKCGTVAGKIKTGSGGVTHK